MANQEVIIYKGYEIRTKNDKTSHSSLIYKDGKFIAGAAGTTTGKGLNSIEKAKAKIDSLK